LFILFASGAKRDQAASSTGSVASVAARAEKTKEKARDEHPADRQAECKVPTLTPSTGKIAQSDDPIGDGFSANLQSRVD